ncbi:acetoacetyl-CoA reductase [Shewanella sp. NKUCC06_TVS]|uniref:acetoacetyl-CoA reductase n=1 Tax=Shewanella sp. NKUCC06_TVS TaxID=2842128 RepID=UPI001C5BE54C|nr:acetoacetyl-CoA reductase [Shewanella sp. NKUCC06_TVS]MBW3530950.1 acetoacetyl-CoA reductase [Shewanella sp. NKUCC06_TVS]
MRVALVTGGTKGIGAAIVNSLSNSGCFVVATYNTTEPNCKKDNVIFKKLDVTCAKSCHQLLTELDEENAYPDILINNAGITKDAMFHKMTSEAWKDVINVNLLSLFNLTQPIFIKMKEKGFGRIVNISSINANKGQIGQVNYCAAKAGIQGFTKALALEGARYGVTVNTISPGYTETSMVSAIKPEILDKIKQTIPTGRLAHVDEVAAAVCYLVSDLAAYTTAANIEVNGGMYSS